MILSCFTLKRTGQKLQPDRLSNLKNLLSNLPIQHVGLTTQNSILFDPPNHIVREPNRP